MSKGNFVKQIKENILCLNVPKTLS